MICAHLDSATSAESVRRLLPVIGGQNAPEMLWGKMGSIDHSLVEKRCFLIDRTSLRLNGRNLYLRTEDPSRLLRAFRFCWLTAPRKQLGWCARRVSEHKVGQRQLGQRAGQRHSESLGLGDDEKGSGKYQPSVAA